MHHDNIGIFPPFLFVPIHMREAAHVHSTLIFRDKIDHNFPHHCFITVGNCLGHVGVGCSIVNTFLCEIIITITTTVIIIMALL